MLLSEMVVFWFAHQTNFKGHIQPITPLPPTTSPKDITFATPHFSQGDHVVAFEQHYKV